MLVFRLRRLLGESAGDGDEFLVQDVRLQVELQWVATVLQDAWILHLLCRRRIWLSLC